MTAARDIRGTGRMAKHLRRVSESAGCREGETLPFAPDFLDSLVRRMATSGGDPAERTFAWLLYRASGNQSDKAIHLYSVKGEAPVETALRQRDCALELAWVEAGHRSEWLDAPLPMFRAEAARRGVVALDKTLICDGFTENRARGTVASGTGYELVVVPSPVVADSTEQRKRKGESSEYQEFCDKWRVAHSAEWEKEQVARSFIKRMNRIRLSDYRESRKSPTTKTNGTPSLEALEVLEASATAAVGPPLSSAIVNARSLSVEATTSSCPPVIEKTRSSSSAIPPEPATNAAADGTTSGGGGGGFLSVPDLQERIPCRPL